MKRLVFILCWLALWAPRTLHAQGPLGSTAMVDGQKLHIIPPSPYTVNYEVRRQPMSHQQVLYLQLGAASPDGPVCVYNEFTSSCDSPFEVDFFLRIVSPLATVRAELQHFDRASGTFQRWGQLAISREDKFIPNNWTRYTLRYDTATRKNNSGDRYRMLFYFAGDSTRFSLTEIRPRATDALAIPNGAFEQWDLSEWPAKPEAWRQRSGSGCIERTRGHLLDDYALKVISAESSPLKVQVAEPVRLESGRHEFVFYARSEEAGYRVTVGFTGLKKTKTFRLGKKWKKYRWSFRAEGIPSAVRVVSNSPGAYYMDELCISLTSR